MPSEWLRRRKRDQFHRKAKERGYRSRATFKLQQIDKRYHFIKRGDRVLDLGAAPGGWLQAARQVVGTPGFVLGVDKEPIPPFQYQNVFTIVADVTLKETTDLIKTRSPQQFDAVISDLSPTVTGVWEIDQARQIQLARSALAIARNVIKPSGNFLVKVFQGADVEGFRKEMRSTFQALRIVKPPASRPESAELYFLGLGYISKRPESRDDVSIRSVRAESVRVEMSSNRAASFPAKNGEDIA